MSKGGGPASQPYPTNNMGIPLLVQHLPLCQTTTASLPTLSEPFILGNGKRVGSLLLRIPRLKSGVPGRREGVKARWVAGEGFWRGLWWLSCEGLLLQPLWLLSFLFVL